MSPVGQALWFIATHLAIDLTLDRIAAAGGVSRFTMVRGFGLTTGHLVPRSMRGGRLAERWRLERGIFWPWRWMRVTVRTRH